MEDGAGDLDELQLWVRQARETAGRQALADAGVALQVASSLPGIVASWETSRSVHERRLLLSLCALRNLCVGLPLAQEQAHQAGLAVTLARLCELAPPGIVVEAALQALGNSCVRHDGNQESTWCAEQLPALLCPVLVLKPSSPGPTSSLACSRGSPPLEVRVGVASLLCLLCRDAEPTNGRGGRPACARAALHDFAHMCEE